MSRGDCSCGFLSWIIKKKLLQSPRQVCAEMVNHSFLRTAKLFKDNRVRRLASCISPPVHAMLLSHFSLSKEIIVGNSRTLNPSLRAKFQASSFTERPELSVIVLLVKIGLLTRGYQMQCQVDLMAPHVYSYQDPSFRQIANQENPPTCCNTKMG